MADGPVSEAGYARLRGLIGAGEGRIGRYRLRREVGRGGMAVVYEAEDPLLRRRVALKVLAPEASRPDLVERLHREARIAADLHHPHIVRFYELGSEPDAAGRPRYFLALEFVDGGSLAEALGSLAPGERLRILETVARAVAYAHAKGVVHRDLKPSNVLLEKGGRVVLTDFGLARAGAAWTELTASNAVMGTPPYMAPEQVEGRVAGIGPRTDVYALGAMLFEAVTGRPPFQAATPAELFTRILLEEPPRPSSLVPGVTPGLDAVCLKALEKDPARRYADAGEFADDLGRLIRGEPVRARPGGTIRRWARRLARRKAAAAAGMALAVAVVLGWWWTAQRSEATRWRDQVLEEMKKRTGSLLEMALRARRMGHLDVLEACAPETEAACREVMRLFPQDPEPHYRLGRMYRALMRTGEALAQQEEALRRDPGHAGALYERLILRADLYRQRLEPLRAVGLRRVDRDEELARLKSGIEEDARRLGDLESARGILAWLRGDLAEARVRLETACDREPDREELHSALGAIALLERRFEKAVQIAGAALERDKGYFPHRELRAAAHALAAVEAARRGEEIDRRIEAARADYDEVLRAAPARYESLRARGILHAIALGSSQDGGGDSAAHYEAARKDLDRAVEVRPEDSKAWLWRGLVQACWAAHRAGRGEEAEDIFENAIRDVEKAVELGRGSPDATLWLGWAWILRGMARGMGESGALSCFERAVETLGPAAEGESPESEILSALGVALMGRALASGRGRAEAGSDLRRAVEVQSRALEGAPEDARLWARRGLARLALAAWGGPIPEGDDLPAQAAADFEESLRRDPRHREGLIGLGRALAMQAAREHRRGNGDQAADLLAQALHRLDRAVELYPAHPWGYLYRSQVHALRARWEAPSSPQAAAEARKAARKDYETALRLNPRLGRAVQADEKK